MSKDTEVRVVEVEEDHKVVSSDTMAWLMVRAGRMYNQENLMRQLRDLPRGSDGYVSPSDVKVLVDEYEGEHGAGSAAYLMDLEGAQHYQKHKLWIDLPERMLAAMLKVKRGERLVSLDEVRATHEELLRRQDCKSDGAEEICAYGKEKFFPDVRNIVLMDGEILRNREGEAIRSGCFAKYEKDGKTTVASVCRKCQGELRSMAKKSGQRIPHFFSRAIAYGAKEEEQNREEFAKAFLAEFNRRKDRRDHPRGVSTKPQAQDQLEQRKLPRRGQRRQENGFRSGKYRDADE